MNFSFNPRAPRGARRPRMAGVRWPMCFNPRAPRGARRLKYNSFGFCVLALELRELNEKLKQRTS